MENINFENKEFRLVNNSNTGTVDSSTIFKYKHSGCLITATYYGGEILYGKILAKQERGKLLMIYHCMTKSEELKVGKAEAKLTIIENNKLKMELDWKWLDSEQGNGSSTYIEI